MGSIQWHDSRWAVRWTELIQNNVGIVGHQNLTVHVDGLRCNIYILCNTL